MYVLTIVALGMAPPEKDPSSMQRCRSLSEEVSASNPSRAAIRHCDKNSIHIDIDMTNETIRSGYNRTCFVFSKIFRISPGTETWIFK